MAIIKDTVSMLKLIFESRFIAIFPVSSGEIFARSNNEKKLAINVPITAIDILSKNQSIENSKFSFPISIIGNSSFGRHPKENNLYLFNGFGSKGVSQAPACAQYLIDFMFNAQPLPKEMDIVRYQSFYGV